MPYQLTGILKLPDGTPAANVDIEFISQANYSPLVRDLSNTIRTSATGSYSVALEYGEYAIRLLYASAYPLHPGKIYVYADTPAGQDLPTLMQAANWTPTTPDYIVQIQNWLVEVKAAHDGAAESAAEAKASELAAKASEIAAEADRAEVAASKAAVSASQADVTTKQADVASKATQVASDKAAAEAAKVAAVSASNSASESASSASGSASAAAASAANSESSALRAEAAAGSLVVEEIQFPDVWIPFSDSLVMLAGYGDEVKVGSYVVAKMASFSRASGATYTDKSGTLRTAAVNEPRFEKEGLLIEGQSTNLCTKSMPIVGDSGWYKGTGATWSNDGIGPDGSPCLKVSGLSTVSQTFSGSALYMPSQVLDATTTYTFSLWVKISNFVGVGPHISLRMSGDNNWQKNIAIPVEDFNKWIRVSASGLGSPATAFCIGTASSSSILDCEIACVQIEALPFASSYIPTSGAAATRAADVCEVPNKGNTIEEGSNITFSMEFDANKAYYNDGVQQNANWRQCLFWGKGDSLRNQLSIMPESSNDKGFGGFISRWGSDGYCLNGVAYHGSLNSKYLSGSVSMRKTAGIRSDISFNINGTQYMSGANHSEGVDTIGSELRIGSGENTTRQCVWGHIRNFRIWHRALSDNQLKSIR